MLKAQKKESTYEAVPAGSYIARCFSIVQMGTIPSKNPTYSPSDKIKIGWELIGKTKELADGKKIPLTVYADFGLTMAKNGKLRPMIESWFGKNFPTDDAAFDFDMEKLLGKKCMISMVETISADGKKYSNVGNVSPIPEGIECPELSIDQFLLTYSKWNQEKFESLPDATRNKMIETPEYKSLFKASSQENEVTEEDIENAFADEEEEEEISDLKEIKKPLPVEDKKEEIIEEEEDAPF